MFRKLISTQNDWAIAVVRVVVGGVMLPHGLQKLLGWFGGFGFANTMNYFAGQGIPKPAAVLVILGESLGAAALVLGFAGRFMALGIALTMAGALAMVHAPNGFFMNWFGNQAGEGFEFDLLVIAMAAAVMIRGSGAASVDLLLQNKLLHAKPRPAPVRAVVAHA